MTISLLSHFVRVNLISYRLITGLRSLKLIRLWLHKDSISLIWGLKRYFWLMRRWRSRQRIKRLLKRSSLKIINRRLGFGLRIRLDLWCCLDGRSCFLGRIFIGGSWRWSRLLSCVGLWIICWGLITILIICLLMMFWAWRLIYRLKLLGRFLFPLINLRLILYFSRWILALLSFKIRCYLRSIWRVEGILQKCSRRSFNLILKRRKIYRILVGFNWRDKRKL